MAEIHKAKLVFEKGKPEIDVIDDVPKQSAVLFKHVSDKIWEQKPQKDRWAVWSIGSVIPAEDAFVLANDAVKAVRDDLVVTERKINFGKKHQNDDDLIVPANTLTTPKSASVETFNWDRIQTGRPVDVDGRHAYAKFADKHRDYARELSAKFRFEVDRSTVIVKYVMQRYQYYQGDLTDLQVVVSHSSFQEMGYDGHHQKDVELTEEQEINILKVIAKIGGIALHDFEQ